MRFFVEVNKDDIFPVVVLKDELKNTQAIVYTFGALLNSFIIDGKQNIIEGYTSCSDAKQNITNGFKNSKLSPFVCRIKNGEYFFQNKQYKTGKFFINEEAIHGLLYDANFTVTASGANEDSAFVKLQYLYSKKDEGFPFQFSCEITYSLKAENELSISTTIINNSEEQMPLCDGWHPYFTFNQPINNILFKLNSNKVLELDDKLIPTGKILHFNNFQTPETLNDIVLDNCFLLNNTTGAACILKDTRNNLKLSIKPSELYPYLQIFTTQHRNSIAIENLSAAPDAFNNKMGLIILKPEESKIFTTAFQVEYY